jgi:serine/threonine protein kinase
LADPTNQLQQQALSGEEIGPAQRVGSIIKGKWTLESLLGVGGMAAVFAASHRNGQRAALKILHIDFAREETICERFLREAYVSNKVGHPATVQVLDDDMTEQEEPFLIMELLEGGTVRDHWKKAGRTMPIPDVLYICDAVLDCLAACHAIGIIHRDLKPANIFITHENVVKVLDFGVAQMRSATTERTATGTALGTPAYMSPEQAMGLVDQMDGRADLFSVGAMMHALVTGQRINNGRTEQEALVMAATKPVTSVARIAPNLPIEVIQIIDKSLAWDRRNRYADAREMQAAVRAALTSQTQQGAQMSQAPAQQTGRRVAGRFPSVSQAPPTEMPPGMTGPRPPAINLSGGIGAVPGVTAPRHPSSSWHPNNPADRSSPPSTGSSPSGNSFNSPSPLQGSLPGNSMMPGQSFIGSSYNQNQVNQAAQAAAQANSGSGFSGLSLAPGMVSENDPRVVTARDVLRHIDHVLPSVRQFGWKHPATDRSLRTAYEAFAEVLARDPVALDVTIRPYSLMILGQPVWEPGPPFDAIPYNLFACGMRALRIGAGLTLDEMRDLLTLLMLDPVRDLPPEDDLAAAFWERGLPHVSYDVVDAFAEGDAAAREAFWDESDRVEAEASDAANQHANRVEAKAMNVATDRSALDRRTGPTRSPLALEEVPRHALRDSLDLRRDEWSDRYVDALCEGYLDAAMNRDAALVLASLRTSGQDLVVAGRMDVLFSLHKALVERLATRVQGADLQMLTTALTGALFGGDTLELLFKQTYQQPDFAPHFAAVLGSIGGNELPVILGSLRHPISERLRDATSAYLERWGQGREVEMGNGLTGINAESAPIVLTVLARFKTPAARQVIAQLGQHEDPMVRVEARVLAASSPEQANQELTQLLGAGSALMRMAAARAATRYRATGIFPTLAGMVRSPSFNELGVDERRELLRALVLLQPAGEPLVLEIAKKGGVLLSEEKEATRLAAMETLGEYSRNPAVATVLREVSTTRWGTSEDARAVAAECARRVTQRIEGGGARMSSDVPAGGYPS